MFSISGITFLLVFMVVLAKSFTAPKYGYFLLLAIILCKPWIFERVPEIYTSFHAPLVLGVVLLLACIASGAFACITPEKKRSIVWLTLFLAACYLSRVSDPAGMIGHPYVSEITNMYLLFILGLVSISTQKDVSDLRNVLLGMLLFLAIISYYNYKIVGWKLPMPSLYLIDRNEFSAIMAASIPIFYSVISTKTEINQYKFIGVLGVFFAISCVIPSDSRGAFLSMLVALTLCWRMEEKKKLYLFVVVIIFFIGYSRVSDTYIERISSSKNYEQEASAAGRIGTYLAAYDMSKDYPLFGVGVGNFNRNFWEYCPDKYREFCAPEKSVHNLFLQVLSETGILGSLFFLLFIWSTISQVIVKFFQKINYDDGSEIMNLGFGYGLIVLYFAYLFMPGAYVSFIYPLSAGVVSAYGARKTDACS